jgi:hypothetical protein
MDVVYIYSHLGGQEILMVRYPSLYREIIGGINSIPNPGRNKASKEKTKQGEMLYSPTEINKLFDNVFHSRGWRELRDYYDIEIPDYPHIVKRAYKQCDFYKNDVLMEIQFGKYAFMFYDLAKFQYFFNQGMIKVGVEIVPCHFLQKQMSSGVSYGEQLVYDLERLSKNFPSVPVMIGLVDMPLKSDDYSIDERREVREAYRKIQNMLDTKLI